MTQQRERKIEKESPTAGELQCDTEKQKADHQICECSKRQAEDALDAQRMVNGGFPQR